MECPKCGRKTCVDATRQAQPDDGPQQILRQRRCLDLACRFRFWTTEEWSAVREVKQPSRRARARARARAAARAMAHG